MNIFLAFLLATSLHGTPMQTLQIKTPDQNTCMIDLTGEINDQCDKAPTDSDRQYIILTLYFLGRMDNYDYLANSDIAPATLDIIERLETI